MTRNLVKTKQASLQLIIEYSGAQELLSISLIGSEEAKSEFIPVEQTTEQGLDQMMKKMNVLRQKYLQQLEWLDVLPVYGDISSSYDINVVKKYLPQILMKNTKKHSNVSKNEKLWIHSIEEDLGRNIERNKKIEKYNAVGYDIETHSLQIQWVFLSWISQKRSSQRHYQV
jgi:hypothetical protein